MVRSLRSRALLAAAALVLGGAAVAEVTPGVPVGASPARRSATTTTPVMQASRLTAVDLAGWYRSTGKVSQATVGTGRPGGHPELHPVVTAKPVASAPHKGVTPVPAKPKKK